jgi:FAD-linked sulfhydryl oxidase
MSSSVQVATATEPKRTTKETHPNLPPGLILDENGKVCKVCNSWRDFAKVKPKAPGGGGTLEVKAGAAAGSSGAGAGAMMGAMGGLGGMIRSRKDCPPDTAQLGRSTWTFLHTTAAYYPITASTEQQGQMRNLLSSLSLLYPCTWCATDFRADISQNPPAVAGRAELSKWLCERHNEVNRKLGKSEFSCTTQKLDERWKDGPADGRCD